ncbi:MAG: hypothetical protein WC602_06645 [archaeon]
MKKTKSGKGRGKTEKAAGKKATENAGRTKLKPRSESHEKIIFTRAKRKLELLSALAEMRSAVKPLGGFAAERQEFLRNARNKPQMVCDFLEGIEVPRIEAVEERPEKKRK